MVVWNWYEQIKPRLNQKRMLQHRSRRRSSNNRNRNCENNNNKTNNNDHSNHQYGRCDNVLFNAHTAIEASLHSNQNKNRAESSIIEIESTHNEPININHTKTTSTQPDKFLNKLKSLFKF